eukprot:6527422-Prymnesium_polylepis.1
MQPISRGNCPEPLKHRARLTATVGSSSRHLAHGTTAHTACQRSSAGVESPTSSATAETVGIRAAHGLRKTWQMRASGAQEVCWSTCSPREASRSQPMSPEA